MKMNNISNDKCEALFLGLSDGKKKMSFDDNMGGTSLFSKGDTTVDLCDLDSFAEENKLTVGFIKTDLEGADFDALRRMVKTIKKDRPVLSLSICHTPKDFFEMKPFLEDVVFDLNYKITIEQHNTSFILCDVMLFAYPKELDE
jgi:hypothetical protein